VSTFFPHGRALSSLKRQLLEVGFETNTRDANFCPRRADFSSVGRAGANVMQVIEDGEILIEKDVIIPLIDGHFLSCNVFRPNRAGRVPPAISWIWASIRLRTCAGTEDPLTDLSRYK
jgi:predicted acyl esterase